MFYSGQKNPPINDKSGKWILRTYFCSVYVDNGEGAVGPLFDSDATKTDIPTEAWMAYKQQPKSFPRAKLGTTTPLPS